MSSVPRPYGQAFETVQIKDVDDGEAFYCDEEPHMLTPEQGHGYYPLTLGQQLKDGQLEIVRKLGWAGYSSVWLARTLKNSYPVQYVAVKVLTVNATAGVVRGLLGEVDALRAIKKTNPRHPGYKHCMVIYDTFIAKSHHGPHICIVTDVFGPDLTYIRSFLPAQRRFFPLALTQRIIKQTLLALDYLHRECKLVHTDVKPDNVLISLKDPSEAITRLLKESPSSTYETRFEPDLSPDPIITVKSEPLGELCAEQDALSNPDICLVDYGEARSTKEQSSTQAQPDLLRAPEVLLGHPWSAPVDVWSVGCLVFEYLTGTALFQLYETDSVSFDDVYLRRIAEFIGPFPPSFLQECALRNRFYDEQGKLLRMDKFAPCTMEACLRNYKVLGEKDISAAAAFIRRCLTLDPRERPTALELLSDPWVKDA